MTETSHTIPEVTNVDGAAQMLKVSARSVRRLIKGGQLAHFRVGRLVRIRVQDVLDIMNTTNLKGSAHDEARKIARDMLSGGSHSRVGPQNDPKPPVRPRPRSDRGSSPEGNERSHR